MRLSSMPPAPAWVNTGYRLLVLSSPAKGWEDVEILTPFWRHRFWTLTFLLISLLSAIWCSWPKKTFKKNLFAWVRTYITFSKICESSPQIMTIWLAHHFRYTHTHLATSPDTTAQRLPPLLSRDPGALKRAEWLGTKHGKFPYEYCNRGM